MVPETQLKRIILVVVFTSLVTYIVLTEIFGFSTSMLGYKLQNNIEFVAKFISFIVSAIIAVLTVKSEKVAHLVLRESYVGGTYEGVSQKIDSNNTITDTHSEKMVLMHNLLSIKLSGESFDSDTNHYGRWDGFVISTEPDVNFYEFVVRISTNTGRHSGFFELTIRDGKINGYHPTRYSKWSMVLSKVSG